MKYDQAFFLVLQLLQIPDCSDTALTSTAWVKSSDRSSVLTMFTLWLSVNCCLCGELPSWVLRTAGFNNNCCCLTDQTEQNFDPLPLTRPSAWEWLSFTHYFLANPALCRNNSVVKHFQYLLKWLSYMTETSTVKQSGLWSSLFITCIFHVSYVGMSFPTTQLLFIYSFCNCRWHFI